MQQGDAARMEREVERIVSLVPALEAAAPERRAAAARAASTRLTRVSLDPTPRINRVARAPRSRALTERLQEALGDREVRAAIIIRRDQDQGGPEGSVVLSIRLEGAGRLWLNSVSRGDRDAPPGLPGEVLVLTFGVSLLAVLGGALLFLRRLTRPINALTEAARAAGGGNRDVRVAENGPRELRAAAHAFNEMQDQIARFDAERMRTLAAVGHDLRTPLTSLRLRAEMLEDPQADDMIRTLEEMTVMADGLVAYARGRGDGEAPQTLELRPLLERLCAELEVPLQQAAPVRIIARPVALTRALRNVIENAQRYGADATVRLLSTDGTAQILVEDRGPGIPEDQLADMLEPFQRGDSSRNTETGGAGLGLAIARDIMVAHGGGLHLANRVGGGLRATLSLPAARTDT